MEMVDVNDHAMKLDYFFDPFCGWCYASAPALRAVAKRFPAALTMRPSGLFAGARPTASIADHSWRNATRITELTGQPYTAQYHDNILRRPQGIFDSIFATRAIAALSEIDPTLGPALLDSLQTARYVDAMETSDATVVASVAAKVGRQHGHSIDEAVFALKLINDEGLSRRTEERIRKTRARMIELSESGVPFLLVTLGKHREVIQNSDLYSGPDVVLKALESVRGRATTAAN
jgi:putative protein-disulfide isomerase